MSLTDAERSTRAQIAALERWAREPDRRAATQAARNGRWAKYLHDARQLAPEGATEQEIARRAESLRTADMRRMSLAASRARRKAAS